MNKVRVVGNSSSRRPEQLAIMMIIAKVDIRPKGAKATPAARTDRLVRRYASSGLAYRWLLSTKMSWQHPHASVALSVSSQTTTNSRLFHFPPCCIQCKCRR